MKMLNQMGGLRSKKMLNQSINSFHSIPRPSSHEPGPFTALTQGLRLSSILSKSRPIAHESIVSFSHLRQEILSQLMHTDQVAGIKVSSFNSPKPYRCGSHRMYRPATHPDLIGISRFFSINLEVSQFPNSTCVNPGFLFCFQIGKTKVQNWKNIRTSHFVACTHTDIKDTKRTHMNWSVNSKHSLWLIGRKKLQIVVSLSYFVAYLT